MSWMSRKWRFLTNKYHLEWFNTRRKALYPSTKNWKDFHSFKSSKEWNCNWRNLEAKSRNTDGQTTNWITHIAQKVRSDVHRKLTENLKPFILVIPKMAGSDSSQNDSSRNFVSLKFDRKFTRSWPDIYRKLSRTSAWLNPSLSFKFKPWTLFHTRKLRKFDRKSPRDRFFLPEVAFYRK